MKALGSIRLGNKRAGAPGKPGPGEIAVDIDRKNRHCQSKFYTACSHTRARCSSTVFAHELPPRSAGFDAENRLYLFALTMPD